MLIPFILIIEIKTITKPTKAIHVFKIIAFSNPFSKDKPHNDGPIKNKTYPFEHKVWIKCRLKEVLRLIFEYSLIINTYGTINILQS